MTDYEGLCALAARTADITYLPEEKSFLGVPLPGALKIEEHIEHFGQWEMGLMPEGQPVIATKYRVGKVYVAFSGPDSYSVYTNKGLLEKIPKDEVVPTLKGVCVSSGVQMPLEKHFRWIGVRDDCTCRDD